MGANVHYWGLDPLGLGFLLLAVKTFSQIQMCSKKNELKTIGT